MAMHWGNRRPVPYQTADWDVPSSRQNRTPSAPHATTAQARHHGDPQSLSIISNLVSDRSQWSCNTGFDHDILNNDNPFLPSQYNPSVNPFGDDTLPRLAQDDHQIFTLYPPSTTDMRSTINLISPDMFGSTSDFAHHLGPTMSGVLPFGVHPQRRGQLSFYSRHGGLDSRQDFQSLSHPEAHVLSNFQDYSMQYHETHMLTGQPPPMHLQHPLLEHQDPTVPAISFAEVVPEIHPSYIAPTSQLTDIYKHSYCTSPDSVRNARRAPRTSAESRHHEVAQAAYAPARESITQGFDPPTNPQQRFVGAGFRIFSPLLMAPTHRPLWQDCDIPLVEASNPSPSNICRFDEPRANSNYLEVPPDLHMLHQYQYVDDARSSSYPGTPSSFNTDGEFGSTSTPGSGSQYATPHFSTTQYRRGTSPAAPIPFSSGMNSTSTGTRGTKLHTNVSKSCGPRHIVDLLHNLVPLNQPWPAEYVETLMSSYKEALSRGHSPSEIEKYFYKGIKMQVGTAQNRSDRDVKQGRESKYFCRLRYPHPTEIDHCPAHFTTKYQFGMHLSAHIGLTDRLCSTCGGYYSGSAIKRHQKQCAKHQANKHRSIGAGA